MTAFCNNAPAQRGDAARPAALCAVGAVVEGATEAAAGAVTGAVAQEQASLLSLAPARTRAEGPEASRDMLAGGAEAPDSAWPTAEASACHAPLSLAVSPAAAPASAASSSAAGMLPRQRPSASAPRNTRSGNLRRRLAHSSADLVRRSLEELPPTARELVRLLDNLDTVLELVSAFGGNTWYIPTLWPLPGTRGGKSTHALRSVLSQGQMQTLTQYYGGTQLYIPRCQRALHRLRNARIVQSFSAGVERGRTSRDLVRGLARRHHLTDRRVWDILKTLS